MEARVRVLDQDQTQLAGEMSNKLTTLLEDLSCSLCSFMRTNHLPVISDMTVIYALEIIRENLRKLFGEDPDYVGIRRSVDVGLTGAIDVSTGALNKIYDNYESYEHSFKQLIQLMRGETHPHSK